MFRDKSPRIAADDVLALQALAAIIACPDLGPRFLALTGLDADALRARAGEPALLGEVIGFLSGHEASLTRIAQEIGVSPAALAAAGERLAR